jgi:hypothetical protein
MSDIVNKKIDSNLSRHVRQLHGIDDLYSQSRPVWDLDYMQDHFERKILHRMWWDTLNRRQKLFYRMFFWLQPFRT